MVDRRRNKHRLLNALFRGCRNGQELRGKIDVLCHHKMSAAAHAIVTGIRRVMLVKRARVRYIAIRRRYEVARKNLHSCKQHEKDRREAERFGPEGHLIHNATLWLFL